VLRLNKGLKLWQIQHSPVWKLADEEWTSLAEIEAVLNISARTTVLVQTEKLFMGAMGPVLYVKMMEDAQVSPRRRQSAVPDDGHFRGFLSLIRLGQINNTSSSSR
jgi:hypothetical protein